MEGKNSFVLYSDQRGIFEKLSNEQAGVLIKHVFSYINDEQPEADFVTELAFESIKTQLKRDLKKWSNIQIKRSEAGKRSAEARKNKLQQTSTNPTSVDFVEQTSTNPTVNVNVNGNVNVINKDIDQAFDQFWKLYDKKVGKDRALKAFKKLNKSEVEQMLMFIPEYVNSQPDKQFRKNPEAFINNKSWNDEIIGQKPTKTSNNSALFVS